MACPGLDRALVMSYPSLQEGLLIPPSWGTSACFMGSPDVGEQVWGKEHQSETEYNNVFEPQASQLSKRDGDALPGHRTTLSGVQAEGMSELVCGGSA